jgi:hypothetical protein
MKRIIFRGLKMLPLLCIATVALWVRCYRLIDACDELTYAVLA